MKCLFIIIHVKYNGIYYTVDKIYSQLRNQVLAVHLQKKIIHFNNIIAYPKVLILFIFNVINDQIFKKFTRICLTSFICQNKHKNNTQNSKSEITLKPVKKLTFCIIHQESIKLP